MRLAHCNPIVVALDVAEAREAAQLTRALAGAVGGFKVGLQLIHAEGPAVFGTLRSAGAERIWYDGKFADIPNTVAAATRALAPHRLWMINVHTTAGAASMAAARDAAEKSAHRSGVARPLVLGVTLLTSLSQEDVRQELGLAGRLEDHVVRLARLARETGLDGAVCSPREAAAVRAACGSGFLIVTPGVRSADVGPGDQRRPATPLEALEAGADYLVVGREITGAADPRAAAERILADLTADVVATRA